MIWVEAVDDFHEVEGEGLVQREVALQILVEPELGTRASGPGDELHDPSSPKGAEQARALTSRVAVLSKGRLVKIGATEEVLGAGDPLALFRGLAPEPGAPASEPVG